MSQRLPSEIFVPPLPSFPVPVPPPAESSTQVAVCFPDTWIPVVRGALQQLIQATTWQGTDEEIAAAQTEAATLIALMTEGCAVSGDVPAPFWDDPDGDDSGDELPPEEQPWYEELSHWVIAGFLAFTFTPAAGIFYITTIRSARIAFRARQYGAVAEILIDGISHGTVDTFSGVEQVIYYDFDIPTSGFSALAFDPVEVSIIHTGTANAEATPTEDGYAIEIIRDYLGRASDGLPVSRIVDGVLETSRDGGETWVETPQSDPRNQVLFPPLTGSDVECRAANSIVAGIEASFDEWLGQLATGSSYLSASWLLVGILSGVASSVLVGTAAFVGSFFGAPVIAVALFLSTFVIDLGIAAVSAALTADVYEKLRCIFLVLVDSDGRMPEENMGRLYAALYEELDATAAQILDLFFDFIGAAGLSNFAAQDADPLAGCGCCPAVAISAGDDFTDGGKWNTFIGRTFSYPDQLVGVYDPTVGRTALGSAKGVPQPGTPSSKNVYVTFDLGTPCRVQTVQFYTRSSSSPAGTPAVYVIAWYNEDGGLMGSNSGVVSTAVSWTLRSNAMNTTGVRYVTVAFLSGVVSDIWLDDVSFILGG